MGSETGSEMGSEMGSEIGCDQNSWVFLESSSMYRSARCM